MARTAARWRTPARRHLAVVRRAAGSGVVAAKTVAGAPRPLLDRPRLSAALKQGMDGQLTVVNGPAGAGKTALVGTICEAGGDRLTGWLTVDPDDNDPVRLWRHLIWALRHAPGSPAALLALTAPESVDAAFLTTVAAAVEGAPGPVAIVLDNAHCLRPGPALDSLAFLLRQRIPRLCLVLGGRGRPALPYPRLWVSGELTEITGADLAFTATEVAQLYAMHGLGTGDAEIERVTAETGGWAAALTLALGGAYGSPPIADYLRTEVLAEQPPEVRDFLLRTGLADELTPELAAALAPGCDAPRLLRVLRERELFLDEPTPGRYRYQPVFRAFLRTQAAIDLGAELPRGHLRAADWYATHGAGLAGARHALAGGQPARAAGLVLPVAAEEMVGERAEALVELIDAIASAIPADPVIAALVALANTRRGEPPPPGTATPSEAGRAVPDSAGSTAGRTCPAAPGKAGTVTPDATEPAATGKAGRTAPGSAADEPIGLGTVRRLTDLLAAEQAGNLARLERCARRLTDDGGADPGTPVATAAWLRLGETQFWHGALEQAETSLRAAGRSAAPEPVRRAALARRALLAALHGYPATAGELLDLATAARPGSGSSGTPHPVGVLAAGYLAWLRGDPAGTDLVSAARAGTVGWDRVLADCLGAGVWGAPAESARPLPALLADWSTIAQADRCLTQGQPAAALALVEPLIRRSGPVALVTGLARVTAARARLAAGEPAQARSVLAPVHAAAERTGPAVSVAGWLCEALAADRLAAVGTVRVALTAALRAAAPHRLYAPFLATEVRDADLLARHTALPAVDPDFLAGLPIPTGPAGPPGALVEPVTERETVVLRYLPTLLTVNDIAGELGVSPNTVKTQLKSLYRKLAVANRRGAVHRARHLGLL